MLLFKYDLVRKLQQGGKAITATSGSSHTINTVPLTEAQKIQEAPVNMNDKALKNIAILKYITPNLQAALRAKNPKLYDEATTEINKHPLYANRMAAADSLARLPKYKSLSVDVNKVLNNPEQSKLYRDSLQEDNSRSNKVTAGTGTNSDFYGIRSDTKVYRPEVEKKYVGNIVNGPTTRYAINYNNGELGSKFIEGSVNKSIDAKSYTSGNKLEVIGSQGFGLSGTSANQEKRLQDAVRNPVKPAIVNKAITNYGK